jgi:hypothetical protein
MSRGTSRGAHIRHDKMVGVVTVAAIAVVGFVIVAFLVSGCTTAPKRDPRCTGNQDHWTCHVRPMLQDNL